MKDTIQSLAEPFGALSLISLLTPARIVSIFAKTSWGASLSSEISLSTLLMKRTGLHCSAKLSRMLVSVWVITPSSASTKITTPSLPRSALLTSPVKEICPGVSLISHRYVSPSNS